MGTLLAELVRVAGISPVLALCIAYGGRRFLVPRHIRNPVHPLMLTLGAAATERICELYWGQTITVPAERQSLTALRNRSICKGKSDGKSIAALAREFGVSRKWVVNILDRHGIPRTRVAPRRARGVLA